MSKTISADGWTVKRVYFLDISENIQDKAEALRIAAERKQLAILTFRRLRVSICEGE